MNKNIYLLFFISIVTLLSSCGGGGSPEKNSLPDNRILFGTAQKGPAIKGGLVHVYELNRHAQRTGKKLLSRTQSHKGDFTLSLPHDWNQFVEVVFYGGYLNEATGSIADPVELNAILDAKQSKKISVNILTTFAASRVKSLSKNKSHDSIARILVTSYQLLETLTGIPSQKIRSLNLLDKGSDTSRALMLLLSGALLEVASNKNTPVQRVLDQLAVDFALDGKFNGYGDKWLRAIQELVHNNERGYLGKYSRSLKQQAKLFGEQFSLDESLPNTIGFIDRPRSRPKVILSQSVCTGDIVTLTGEASRDVDDGTNLSYRWFRVDHNTGVPVILSERSIAKDVSFVAPDVSLIPTYLIFSLVVKDRARKTTHTESITISIFPLSNNKECNISDGKLSVKKEFLTEVNKGEVKVQVNQGAATRLDLKHYIVNASHLSLIYNIISPSSHGRERASFDGVLSYFHNGGNSLEDALIVEIIDADNPSRKVTITIRFNITLVNVPPVIIDDEHTNIAPVLQPPYTINFAENKTDLVLDISSIDPNGIYTETDSGISGLKYSITGGEDGGLFEINADSGKLQFIDTVGLFQAKVEPDSNLEKLIKRVCNIVGISYVYANAITRLGPNFEAPRDQGGDNSYKVEVTVTETNINRGTVSRGLFDTETVIVKVRDVNEFPPVFVDDQENEITDDPLTIPFLENQDASVSVLDIKALDEDAADTISYTIIQNPDDDSSFLHIDGEKLKFISSPNYEAYDDTVGDDSHYRLQIKASDGERSDILSVDVEVMDINEFLTANPDSVYPESGDFMNGMVKITRNVLANDAYYTGALPIVSLVPNSLSPLDADVILNGDGEFTYRESVNNFGADVTFTYQIDDAISGLSDTAIVTIHGGG